MGLAVENKDVSLKVARQQSLRSFTLVQHVF